MQEEEIESPSGTSKITKKIIVSLILILLIATSFGGYLSLAPGSSSHNLGKVCYSQNVVNVSSQTGRNSSASYDEQWAAQVQANLSSISYNVTAVDQNDGELSGPYYLVNALANNSVWYQVGIFTPASFFLRADIFSAGYQTWNSTSKDILQTGPIHLSTNQIDNSDVILLSISYKNGFVKLEFHDWNTSAAGTVFLPSGGPVYFVGSANQSSFFTGPMTEWYHPTPYFCSPDRVLFSNSVDQQNWTWTCIDEYNFTGVPIQSIPNATDSQNVLFGRCNYIQANTLAPNSFQQFSFEGSTIYYSEHEFITP
jgi:hypothetical protein